MIGKTVAELMEGIVPSAYAVNVVSLLDDKLCITKSDACYPLSIIERVFGPVLAELNEHIAALNALLVQKDIENANLSRACAELTETKADFYRSGVAEGRAQKDVELVETREALRLAHDHMRLYLKHYHTGQNVFDSIHAVLTAAKKDVERTNFSIEYKTDPNIRTFLHTSDGVFHIDADGKRERMVDTPSVNEELFVVAQQHPSRPEVSMFTANAKVAEEYKRIGWTVLKIDRAEAAKKESGE